MSLPYDNKLIWHAKTLRKSATAQENRLWYAYLRSFPVRFQRQKVIRSCIVDFYCHAARLVIELDGDQHGEPERLAYDKTRTAELNKQGLFVLRFTNEEIDKSLEAVCACINQTVRDRLPPELAATVQLPKTEYDQADLFVRN